MSQNEHHWCRPAAALGVVGVLTATMPPATGGGRGDQIDIPGIDADTKIDTFYTDPQFNGGDLVLTQESAASFMSNWDVG
jgi:hypothetical protein